eukprot:scaffold37766_cov120-Skeletonema_marinoi.AAC.2
MGRRLYGSCKAIVGIFLRSCAGWEKIGPRDYHTTRQVRTDVGIRIHGAGEERRSVIFGFGTFSPQNSQPDVRHALQSTCLNMSINNPITKPQYGL